MALVIFLTLRLTKIMQTSTAWPIKPTWIMYGICSTDASFNKLKTSRKLCSGIHTQNNNT